MKKGKLFILLLLPLAILKAQPFDELALTPPMGWNSWNKFGCDVSESLIMDMADALVESGMKEAGFEYVVIDDCWQVGRDSAGYIIADPIRFPNGIKYVADYVHALGLKFGIYSCAGSKTCQGRPGSRGFQEQDAKTYADWDVDYLKYDWCYNQGQDAETAYKTMSDALKECGRPIVFSICEWGSNEPWLWGNGIGHLWRTTHDIKNSFNGKMNVLRLGVLDIIDRQADLWPYAGPGHWNDPDMLEVGNKGLSHEENISHFSMWAMLAAPLIAGNDLRNMKKEVKEILTNSEVIKVDQDSLGEQAFKFIDRGKHEIWVKFLSNNELAVCFLNRSRIPWLTTFNWKNEDIIHKYCVSFNEQAYTIRNLWKHKETGTTDELFIREIPGHGVLMLRLSPLIKDKLSTNSDLNQEPDKFILK